MNLKTVIVFLLLACLHAFGGNNSQAKETYVVEEFMDELIVIFLEDELTGGIKEYHKVFFIRNEQIMARRTFQNRYGSEHLGPVPIWSTVLKDGESYVQFYFQGHAWKDGHAVDVDRYILTKSVMYVILPTDPDKINWQGPWWAQNRNMRDLKAP
jgi:hypothetical protein